MKIYFIIFCLSAALISISCNENFNPKAPFIEQYVLNCIIRGDSVAQVALLGKTYDVNGYDPSTNSVDPSVTGALIYIKCHGKIYQMRDSSIARTDTSQYKGPVKFYYSNSFLPGTNDTVEITAIPKDGVILNSKTTVPNSVSFDRSPVYIKGDEAALDLTWVESDGGDFFLPRLKIVYSKRNEIPQVIHTLEVPVSYNYSGNLITPIYPGVSAARGLEYQRSILDDYMTKVSAGDDMENYQFYDLEFDLLIFDQFLSGYISTTNGFLDNLSIRLDEPNYTNITGGLGIFGAYMLNKTSISLSDNYLTQLGYTP